MQRDPVVPAGPRASARWLAALLAALGAGHAFAACSGPAPLACASTAAGECPSLDGVTSFCSWAEWGCASEPPCGGYFVLRDEGTDARLTYYYAAATGAFVATVKEAPARGSARAAWPGPSSFVLPTGCEVETLASCGPPPRDGGVTLVLDARADAPFSAPSPSGGARHDAAVRAPSAQAARAALRAHGALPAQVGRLDQRIVHELRALPLDGDLAGPQHVRAPARREREAGVLLDEQDRDPTRRDRANGGEDLGDELRRDPERRLVEEEEDVPGRAMEGSRAIASICCSPPERVAASCCIRSPRRGNSAVTSSSVSRIAARSRCVYAPPAPSSRAR